MVFFHPFSFIYNLIYDAFRYVIYQENNANNNSRHVQQSPVSKTR